MTTTRTAAPSSLIRASALVLLIKHLPHDALGLHAKVDGLLQDHGYAPVPLSHVSSALSSLNAQSLIKPDDHDATKYDVAEGGFDLVSHTLSHMEGAKDEYAIARTLSLEARV